MDTLKKFARSIRGTNGEGSLQAFHGAIASRNPNGGPQFHESKRDYAALRRSSDRYMLF